MTLTSGIFNSINGDRRYNPQWFASYFASFIGNGVFPNPSTGLQVVEGTNMETIVKAGQGWINGYYLVNDSNYVLKHDVADGVLKRIDRVVMRLNFLTRQIEIEVKKGTFASSPIAPVLQRDTDAYELALADVLINNGATVITQANITDQRLNTSLCGIVHGVVNQVDTTTIFNQYQSWFVETKSKNELEMDQWQMMQEQEFNQWFASIRDILDGDVAANLANRISTLEQTVTAHLEDDERHISSSERMKWNQVVTDVGLKENLQTEAKTDLVSAINEVFQTGNNVKADMVDALLQVDPSLPTTYESSWEEIETAISQINTGKKFASGTITDGYTVEVTGLTFKPSFIFIELEASSTNKLMKNYNAYSSGYLQNLATRRSGTTYEVYSGNSHPWTVTENGFSTRTNYTASGKWWAIE